MNNGINKQRKEMREALLCCLATEDIQEMVKRLLDIVVNEKSKPMEVIRASQVILDYTTGKPKQDFGIELEGEENEKKEFLIRTVDHITKGIEKYYLNYNEYITAVERGEIEKNEKALIGNYDKEREMENDIKRMKEEHNLE